MKGKEIQPRNFTANVSEYLHWTLHRLEEGVEVITGFLSSEKRERVFSAGHVVQGFLKGKGLLVLGQEWDQLKEKGKIKEDYDFTEQCSSCLLELLQFLDSDIPDEKRFDLLKRIFLIAAVELENVTDRNSHLPLQYMQICRTMSAGEILLLNATFRIAEHKKELWQEKHVTADSWLEILARESGLKHTALVAVHEDELTRKQLLTERVDSTLSGITKGKHFRLTDLGYEMCRYIERYDEFNSA